jgi:hypothetical protein
MKYEEILALVKRVMDNNMKAKGDGSGAKGEFAHGGQARQ